MSAYLKDLLKEFFEGGEKSDGDDEEGDMEDDDLADLCAMMDGYEAGQEPADRRVDVRRMVATTITIFVSTFDMGCRHDKVRGRDLASKLDVLAVEVGNYDEEAAAVVEDLAGRVRRAVEAARAVSG